MLNKLESKKIYLILLAIILFVGFLLRIAYISEQSYWIDEGFTNNAVISTIEKGEPRLDSGFLYKRSILNTYVIATSVRLFGFNHFATRLPAVLFGTVLILIIYLFSKELFKNERVALLSAGLTSLSYLQIAWSRQARMYMQFEVFFFLAIYLFYLTLRKQTWTRFSLLIASTVAAIFSHEFGLLLIPLYLFGYLLYFYGPFVEDHESVKKTKSDLNRFLAKYFWYVFAFFVAIVPLAGIKAYSLFFSRLIENLDDGDAAKEFFIGGQFINLFQQDNLLLIIGAIMGVLIYILFNKKMYPGLFLFLTFVLPFYIIISSTDLLHLRYLTFLSPILLIFIAYFVSTVIEVIAKRLKSNDLYVNLAIVLVLVLVPVFSAAFVIWPQATYKLEFRTPQPDFKAAYAEIEKAGFSDKDIIISPYPAMDKVYLGRSDYWLPISLSGKSSEVERERSLYTGAPKFLDFDNLKPNRNYYLVLDEMAINRLGKEFLNYLEEFHEMIYFGQTKKMSLSRIWVFRLQ
jgi:hypothetical protein